MNADLSTLKDIATLIGGVIAVVALIKGVIEYSKQVTIKRAEYFLNMRRQLKETQTLKELCDLIELNDPKLVTIPLKDKLHLTGFFEEIALMMNSGLIRKNVAHYMFGYYALRCWESTHFWQGLNRETMYWSLLRNFVEEMKEIERNFKFSKKAFRL